MRVSALTRRPMITSALVSLLGLAAACTSAAPAPDPIEAPAAAPVVDTAFTIAVLPDTQNYLDYTHQKAEGFPFEASEMFLEQMQFIADNLEPEGGEIAFVSSLGDVWQHQTLAMDEEHKARGFERARQSDHGFAFRADRQGEDGRDAESA